LSHCYQAKVYLFEAGKPELMASCTEKYKRQTLIQKYPEAMQQVQALSMHLVECVTPKLISCAQTNSIMCSYKVNAMCLREQFKPYELDATNCNFEGKPLSRVEQVCDNAEAIISSQKGPKDCKLFVMAQWRTRM
jgi:hypothetical protein